MRELEGIAGLEALAEADRALRPASGRPLTAEMRRLLLAAVEPGAYLRRGLGECRTAFEVVVQHTHVTYSPETSVFALWGEGLLDRDATCRCGGHRRKFDHIYTVNDAGRELALALQEASHG